MYEENINLKKIEQWVDKLRGYSDKDNAVSRND